MKYYDTIVIGAGPAGLGSALNLAKKGIDVLLIEQNKIGTSKKTWLTFDYILQKYDLTDCIRNKFSDIILSCYLGGRYCFKKKDFIYPIHEKKALKTLAEKSKNNGVTIKEQESFINYSYDKKNSKIIIHTTKDTYQTKIAVDAMGRESQILNSNGLGNDTVDMGCLAFFIRNVKNKNDNKMLLYDSFFPGTDYFWTVPLEQDKIMVGIFSFSTLTNSNINEKSEKLKFYIQSRKIKGQIYDKRMGNIPLGGQRNINLGPFLCIGDSCNTPLPSSGFSFNRCLDESEILADFIADYLDNNALITDYKKKILGSKFPGIEIHLIISDMLAKFTNPILNKSIEKMNNLGEEFIISFLTGKHLDINFSVNALKAILGTFSLKEIQTLSLKQNHLKNLYNLYNLLPGLTSAKLTNQLIDFVKGMKNTNTKL
jgi:flavin-dependent dehydrogenase